MRITVSIETLIQRCDARLEYLHNHLDELESEQEEGQWRKDLENSLTSLAGHAASWEVDDITSTLSDLRSLAKAEGNQYAIRDTIRQIAKVEKHRALFQASTKDSYSVDPTDTFLMSIMQPTTTVDEN